MRRRQPSVGTPLVAVPLPLHPAAVGVLESRALAFVTCRGSVGAGGSALSQLAVVNIIDAPVPRLFPLGTELIGLAIDEKRERVFVADRGPEDIDGNAAGPGLVYALDAASGEVLGTAAIGREPRALALDPGTGILFVANGDDNTVSVVDASRAMLTVHTSVGFEPTALALVPWRGRVFVANYSGGTVSVLESTTGTLLTTVKVGSCPQSFAVDEIGSRVFVANWNDSSISVLDDVDGRVISTVATDRYPSSIVLDSEAGRLFVAHSVGGLRHNRVSVINLDTLRPDQAKAWTRPLLGGYPVALAADEVTGYIFAASAGDGALVVLDMDAPADASPVVRSVSLTRFPHALTLAKHENRCLVVGDADIHSGGILTVLDAGRAGPEQA